MVVCMFCDYRCTLADSRETSHSNLADSFSKTSTSLRPLVNSTRGAEGAGNMVNKRWSMGQCHGQGQCPTFNNNHPSKCCKSLTLDFQEAGGFEVLCVAGVHLGIVRSAVTNYEGSLASINSNFMFLGLADLLPISEPIDLSVLPGHFTLKGGSGLFFNRLVLQRFAELNWWLCTHRFICKIAALEICIQCQWLFSATVLRCVWGAPFWW